MIVMKIVQRSQATEHRVLSSCRDPEVEELYHHSPHLKYYHSYTTTGYRALDDLARQQ